jgi:molybdopterin molybdotransferase
MRGFRDRRPVAEALAILEPRTGPLAAERVPVTECIGRVLAADVTARVAVPHFARAAMDGYALAAASIAGATGDAPVDVIVVGEVRAGGAQLPALSPGEAARITTGAPVPDGADCVLMAEKAEERPLSEARGTPPSRAVAVVRTREAIPRGKHVGAVGEDVPAGSVIVRAGRRLRPQDAGVLASAGVLEVSAVRRPTVRVLVTGDELVAPGEVPSGSRIVDTNSLVLSALAARDGAATTVVERVRDDRGATREALLRATEDVILVSGGSSVGPEDHAPLVVAELGDLVVHGVALRPASPTGFGFLSRGSATIPVFLLPGNPVSCLCAYEMFAGPAVRALGGLSRGWPHRRKLCTVGRPITSERGRTDYTRVTVEGDIVTPLMTSGASILSSTTRADGVILVEHDRSGYAEGETAVVFLYDDG